MLIKKKPLDRDVRYLYTTYPPVPIQDVQMYKEYRRVVDYLIFTIFAVLDPDKKETPNIEFTTYTDKLIDELNKWEGEMS